MEKFPMSEVVQKMIVETDGKLKQATLTERYAARKAEGKDNNKTWEDMRDQQQQMIKDAKELLEFLEEVKAEYADKK